MTDFRAGDRVYIAGSITGSYAEYASLHDTASASIAGQCFVRARRCDGYAVRDGVSRDDSASGSAAGRNCSRSWRERRCRHGCVTTGARPWIARVRHREYGRGAQIGAQQGAHEVFDHGAPDHFEQIMNATSGRGVDVIVEMLANVNLAKDLTILSKNGRVAVIGNRGRIEIDPRDTMMRDADIRGMALPNTPPEKMASIHAALVAGLENGTLRPVIGKEFPSRKRPQRITQ